MHYTTLITTDELAPHLGDPDWAIIDCRFKLDNAAVGREAYLAGHIPGAIYAHLNDDLSGPIIPGQTGRHPLPTLEQFAKTLSQWGIDERVQVIAYDDNSGVYAGRLWWMLRWLGHFNCAVLDGDLRHWQREGRPTISGAETRARRRFLPYPQPHLQVSVDDVVANVADPQFQLFDARDEKRFRGEVNALDPIAGHIPGAKSAFYAHNLDANGKFLPPEQLRARFAALLDEKPVEECVFYCGSGVSLHHNLLALAHAGFAPAARVYIGSWSDWINDPTRPVATGE
ncbi:MAG: sulfurtransferase [Caldilineaceae bacterium]|nr:sulfurtransferase [Caldilineaceae bacterium]